MVSVANRYDAITGQRYTNLERLEMSLKQVKGLYNYVSELERMIKNISDDVDDENLTGFACGIEEAEKALENAVRYGYSNYVPKTIKTYHWKEVDKPNE